MVLDRIQDWIEEREFATTFIEPASPWQNGQNESVNVVLRDGCSSRWLFVSVREARLVVERLLVCRFSIVNSLKKKTGLLS